MKIRDYKDKDKDKVLRMVKRILLDVFDGDPAEFAVLKEFDVKENYIKYLVIENEEQPLGERRSSVIATMALKRVDKDTVRLKRMYVNPVYQNTGLSQKLFDLLVDYAKKRNYKRMLLHIYPIMDKAYKFFERNNFKETTGKDPDQIHVVKELS